MNNVKKGDIVTRKSHNHDVVFFVDMIVNDKIAVLRGITVRLKADAHIEDLKVINKNEIKKIYNILDSNVKSKITSKEIQNNNFFNRNNKIVYTGRILHLDGDKKYSEKSNMYYKKMGLKAIVKNITERNQVSVANNLIERYNPDIVVITGHDRNDKIRKKL